MKAEKRREESEYRQKYIKSVAAQKYSASGESGSADRQVGDILPCVTAKKFEMGSRSPH